VLAALIGFLGDFDLAEEATQEADVEGLLAMMLLLDARCQVRFRGGDLVLLADQDRSLWDTAQIAAGRAVLEQARCCMGADPYVLQAPIASLHVDVSRLAIKGWGGGEGI
jgi:RNA polymerase sigma-70 factor, ECF subfamily